MVTPITQRPHDLVIWGATGVVGKLICEHLARSYTVRLEFTILLLAPGQQTSKYCGLFSAG